MFFGDLLIVPLKSLYFTSLNLLTTKSISPFESAADIWVLILAKPLGTTG